jgi:hypothetical protein
VAASTCSVAAMANVPVPGLLGDLASGLTADPRRPVRLALHTGPPRPAWWEPGMPPALVELLASFRYKPKWEFRLGPAIAGGWVLRIRSWVPDVHDPDSWGYGNTAIPVPPYDGMGAEDWQEWLHEVIISGPERHETDEWFRVGGERPYDPHAHQPVA